MGKGLRKSTREADDPTVPDWPNEKRCECCGKPCWSAEAEDGSEVLLDVNPMETELVTELYGEVRRVRAVSSYVHPGAYHVRGWVLRDPVHVVGEEEEWCWYASRVPLSVDAPETLYSEHVYVCKKVSPKVVEGLLSNVTFHNGAAGDIYGTRAKKVAVRQRRAQVEAWVREGNTVPLPGELGEKPLEAATQLPLFY
jgi:hypothetical protein